MFDIWRAGFIRRPLSDVIATHGPEAGEIVWLPPAGPFRYLADPFGVTRDGAVTVFVEAFDYRVGRGEIHYYRHDAEDRLMDQGVALAESWHLSYPSLIEDGGELYMLPEGYRSGALTLYRCVRFPDLWEPAARLLDAPAIDATVVRTGAGWRMFYAVPGPDDRAMRELHVASADALTGPWKSGGPVLSGFDTSRPGGTAFESGGAIYLPIQDCDGAYGRAINLLRIEDPSPDAFRAQVVGRFEPGDLLEGFADGLHTLSGHGDVTFIDVKSVRRSPAERWIRTQYKVRRLLGLNGPRRPKNFQKTEP